LQGSVGSTENTILALPEIATGGITVPVGLGAPTIRCTPVSPASQSVIQSTHRASSSGSRAGAPRAHNSVLAGPLEKVLSIMADQLHPALTILRRKQVEARTGLSRSTIYLRIARGEFPAPVSLGARAVGWNSDDVQKWIAERIAQPRKGA
jgi:prophage regulatory protein